MDFDLATLDADTGKAPESRIKSAAGVRNRIGELRRAEGTRSLRRAKQDGLLDGNPPYPPSKMRELGRANDANINLRTSEGILDAAKTPYYDLIFETPRFTNIEIEYGDDPQKNFEWSETVSTGFHNLIDGWDGHDFNVQLEQRQMCFHGVGNTMWQDRLDWRWRARKIGDVLVPDDAEADIDELPECAVPRSIDPTKLYKMIRNEDAARINKWNIGAVRKAIIAAAPDSMRKENGDNWESYQESLRCGDISWGNKSSKIHVVDYFVKEFDGSITRVMVLYDQAATTTDTAGNDKDAFLMKKEKYADSFREILCPSFFDIGTSLWHSIKGLAPKIFDFCELENRLTGRLIDQAMAGLFVGADSADALQRMQLVPHGPVTVMPPGISMQNSKLAEHMQGPLAVKRDLQGMLQSNTGQYRQRNSNENHEPTLGQAQLNAQNSAILSKGAVNRYYKTLDRRYREMLRRVLNPKLKKDDPGGKEALEFREWCMDHGVPKEALEYKRVRRIKAVRSIGYGSPAMRELVSSKLAQMLPMMDETSRRNAQRTMLAPYVGQHQIDAYFPPASAAGLPDDHAAVATLENNALRQPGGQVLITPQQNHFTHFKVHLSDAFEHLEELKAGQAQPVAVLGHLHQVGPHLRQHLDAMQGDPTRKEQLGQMEAAWQMLSKMADQLQQQTEEALRAEQADAPPPQPDPKTMAALAKVQGELEIKRIKTAGDLELKAQKQDAMLRLKDAQAAHDMRLENLTAAPGMPAEGELVPTV